MGFFSYVSEEVYKFVSNFKQLVISFLISVCVYGSISYVTYISWDWLMGLHEDKFYFRYFFPQFWHLLWMAVIHLFLCVVYEIKHPLFERYRYVDSWPWEKNPVEWKKLYNRTFWNYVINQCIILPIHAFIFSYVGEPYNLSKEQFPGFFEMFWQVIFFDFCNDVFLFVEHVILHSPSIYQYIHKVHHEYIDVVGISGEYFHPIEFFLASTGTILGPKLLGAQTHMFSYNMWQFTRVYDNIVQNHSGYNFPWRPLGICPFQNGPSYHYYHHDRNVGTFSFNYNFLDRMFGWDTEFRQAVKRGEVKIKAD